MGPRTSGASVWLGAPRGPPRAAKLTSASPVSIPISLFIAFRGLYLVSHLCFSSPSKTPCLPSHCVSQRDLCTTSVFEIPDRGGKVNGLLTWEWSVPVNLSWEKGSFWSPQCKYLWEGWGHTHTHTSKRLQKMFRRVFPCFRWSSFVLSSY